MSQRIWQGAARRAVVTPWQGSQALYRPARAQTSIMSRVLSSNSALKNSYASDADETLVQQRLRRPVAPHLTIYGFQVNYIGSGLNRITGVVLSGGFYLAFMAHALGMPLSSAAIAGSVAGWSILSKVLLKATLAFPFTYHSFAGVRHIYLDFAKGFANKQYVKSMWVVVGLSGLSSLYLAFAY